MKENLRIPSYQRPYKWNRKHIRNLFYDFEMLWRKKEYQVGSVIFHDNGGYLDIVDGQQRLISISLFSSFIRKVKKRIMKVLISAGAECWRDILLSCKRKIITSGKFNSIGGTSQAKEICNFIGKLFYFLYHHARERLAKPFNYLILRLIVENL